MRIPEHAMCDMRDASWVLQRESFWFNTLTCGRPSPRLGAAWMQNGNICQTRCYVFGRKELGQLIGRAEMRDNCTTLICPAQALRSAGLGHAGKLRRTLPRHGRGNAVS